MPITNGPFDRLQNRMGFFNWTLLGLQIFLLASKVLKLILERLTFLLKHSELLLLHQSVLQRLRHYLHPVVENRDRLTIEGFSKAIEKSFYTFKIAMLATQCSMSHFATTKKESVISMRKSIRLALDLAPDMQLDNGSQ